MSTKRKATTIAKPVVKDSAKTASKIRIDEAQTTVSTGLSPRSAKKQQPEVIELSDSESIGGAASDGDEELGDDEQLDQQIASENRSGESADVDMENRSGESADVDMENEGDASDGEPTFGELLRGEPVVVDIAAAMAAQAEDAPTNTRAELRQRHASLVSSNSLGTVLNQALRTNDADLLESCLQTDDHKIVENTISRMDTELAMTLLDHLATRMHRRPGRALNIMMWMKLTMIAHGGTLVDHPDRVARLTEVQRVLEVRAKSLPTLLQLKGKLDLLGAQLSLRKAMASQAAAAGEHHEHESSDEDEDEAQIVYVEGEEEIGSRTLTNGAGASRGAGDDEEDHLMANAVIEDSDEDSEDFGEEPEEDLAEVESMDEDEVDHDDVDDEEEMSEADAERPSKVRRTSARLSQRK